RWKELGCFFPRIERRGGRESSCARGEERCWRHTGNRYLLTASDDASHAPTRDIPETRMAVLILQAVPNMGEGKKTLVACHPGHSVATERSSPHGGAYAVATRGRRAEAERPPPAEREAEAGKARGESGHKGMLPP